MSKEMHIRMGCIRVFTALACCVATTAQAGSLGDAEPTPNVNLQQGFTNNQWAGAYVGATAGYAFNGDDSIGVGTPDGRTTGFGNYQSEGWSGSLRAGYFWQFGALVLGPEISFEMSNISDTFSQDGYSGTYALNQAATFRYKTGYDFTKNNLLIYGIAGVSRAEFDYSITGNSGIGPVNLDQTFATNGYVLGVGMERLLTDRLSLTGEYEYSNFGKETLTDGLGNTTNATPEFHRLKFGINLRF